MSAGSLAKIICNLSKKLAESLRSGDVIIADARVVDTTIRESIGWLMTARDELDPSNPIGTEPD